MSATPTPSGEDLVEASLRMLEKEFGAEAASELLESFLRDTPERLLKLARPEALLAPAETARAAHSLAGSAGIFGLETLRVLGLEIEEALRSGRADEFPRQVEALHRSFREVQPLLHRGWVRLRNSA